MRKVVIGLSGGMDSATLLGLLLGQGLEVHCCSFTYGSKHGAYELGAAKNIVDYYLHRKKHVVHHIIDLTASFYDFQSALLLSGAAIPEGHYEAETMKQTVVPGRNLIFASIMAGLAESIGADEVMLGVHAGDHAIYPDCRPVFIKSLAETVLKSSDNKVCITAPWLFDTKAQILYKGFYGLKPKVPYHLTRTCYKDQLIACGKCGSCVERLEAFATHSLKDPIPYEV